MPSAENYDASARDGGVPIRNRLGNLIDYWNYRTEDMRELRAANSPNLSFKERQILGNCFRQGVRRIIQGELTGIDLPNKSPLSPFAPPGTLFAYATETLQIGTSEHNRNEDIEIELDAPAHVPMLINSDPEALIRYKAKDKDTVEYRPTHLHFDIHSDLAYQTIYTKEAWFMMAVPIGAEARFISFQTVAKKPDWRDGLMDYSLERHIHQPMTVGETSFCVSIGGEQATPQYQRISSVRYFPETHSIFQCEVEKQQRKWRGLGARSIKSFT